MKLNAALEVTETLDMNQYIDNAEESESEEKNYELFAACLHHGPNINTGHYTSKLSISLNTF